MITDGYPLVRFVDAPSADANIRFDFNEAGVWADDDIWVRHPDFSIGAPGIEGDPDTEGVQYTLRTLTFNIFVEGSKTNALARLSALSREILRRENWLMFQLSELTPPIFFLTYRTGPEALDFENVLDVDDAVSNLWGLGVTLDADSFAYGERITLDPISVVNSPADATHPFWFSLPEITGDAPVPLRVEVNPDSSTQAWFFDRRGVHLVMSHADATPVRVQTADSTNIGATLRATIMGNEFLDGDSMRRTAVPTTLTKLFTATKTVPFGRYKMFLRLESQTGTFFSATDQFSVWLGLDIDAITYRKPFDYRPTNDTGRSFEHWQWAYMGEVQHPFGGSPIDGSGALSLALWASRGASNFVTELQFDEIILVPVDEDEPGTQALAAHGKFSGDSDTLDHSWIYDGDTDAAYQLANGIPINAYPGVAIYGQLPVAIPGRTNRLLVNPGAAIEGLFDAGADDITRMNSTVTISYQPRWLHLADS